MLLIAAAAFTAMVAGLICAFAVITYFSSFPKTGYCSSCSRTAYDSEMYFDVCGHTGARGFHRGYDNDGHMCSRDVIHDVQVHL